MARQKLTFLLPSLRGGGAERVILTLSQLMVKKGYSVDLVLVRSTGAFKTEVPADVNLIDLGHSRAAFSLISLARYIRQSRPDVLLPSLPHITIITLITKWLCRYTLVTLPIEHNTLSALLANSKSPKQTLLPLLMRITYPTANKIICVSRGVEKDLKTTLSLPDHKLTVIYNPVNTSSLIQLSQHPTNHPWLKNRSSPLLLAVGRLTYAKGFDVLINAMSIVHAKSKAKLIILGEGPEKSRLHELIQDTGLSECISIPGFTNNPYPYFKRASLFVLSSRWEGLPTVLIEAIACGAKVISTDCPSGPREILGANAERYLVPVGDHCALATKILETLDGHLDNRNQVDLDKFTEAYSQKEYHRLIRQELDAY